MVGWLADWLAGWLVWWASVLVDLVGWLAWVALPKNLVLKLMPKSCVFLYNSL